MPAALIAQPATWRHYVRLQVAMRIGFGEDVLDLPSGELVALGSADTATVWCLHGWAVPVLSCRE